MASVAHSVAMALLNTTPFPLFLTDEEFFIHGPGAPLEETLVFADCRIVPVTTLVSAVALDEIHEHVRLTERVNADVIATSGGELYFEYASTQLEVILALTEEQSIRATDAAAFIAQQVFPDLNVLDSASRPIGSLDALPHHDGVNQRSFHDLSQFPLSVNPPPWFPQAGMPNVTFHAPQ